VDGLVIKRYVEQEWPIYVHVLADLALGERTGSSKPQHYFAVYKWAASLPERAKSEVIINWKPERRRKHTLFWQ
jgi:hypothetical protein